MTNHIIRLCLNILFLIGLTFKSWADTPTSSFLNIYLKLSPQNPISTFGDQFKSALSNEKELKKYKLKPVFEEHPLHITLYLTQYPIKNNSLLIKRVKKLAQQAHSFTITTERLIVTPSRYIMLTVKPQPYLQHLSDRVVLSVSPLRDYSASIPAWAATNLKKTKSFKHYGSPNVFANYNPHFTLLTPYKVYPVEEERKLSQYLQHIVTKFNQNYSPINASINAIAIGFADEQGQIIKELASFPLK
ncbi:2'-5' RNA ligase family protein [Legionella sp. D16C41]|uniref:2'-5' RNA ligase family protein n=1 Tax=Legionella sp. D16C41 TaxID=3402688 RepID=UPI003AF576CF